MTNTIKKDTLIITVLVLFLLSPFACKQQDRSSAEETFFPSDSITFSQKHFFLNDSTLPYYSLTSKIVFPSSQDSSSRVTALLTSMALGIGQVQKNASEAVSTYFNTSTSNFDNELLMYRKLNNDPSFELINLSQQEHIDIQTEAIFPSLHLLSMQTVRQVMLQDDLPKKETRNLTIDTQAENILSEEDIFIPGYKHEIHLLMVEYLIQQQQVKTAIELEDFGFFSVDLIAPNNNFMIKNGQIIYTFNPGEIAIISLGAINIPIPLQKVEHLIKPESIIHPIL